MADPAATATAAAAAPPADDPAPETKHDADAGQSRHRPSEPLTNRDFLQ